MNGIVYTTKINSNLTTDLKTCKSIEVYKELCENFNVYEKIPDDKPVHPYFDIDYYNENMEYDEDLTEVLINLGKTYITSVFEEIFSFTPEFCILTSCSSNYVCSVKKCEKWKISIHLVIKNCLMLKSHLNEFIVDLNRYSSSVKDDLCYHDYINVKTFFDESVYDKNRKMRAWNASKEGENRPMVLLCGQFEDSIITNLGGNFPIFEYAKAKTSAEPSTTTYKENDYIQKYRDYVSIISREEYFEPYDKWFKFQRASANIGIPFEIYDEYMRDCKGYDYDKNKEYYEMPENNKNGRLGWGCIYEMARESNLEKKNELDAKYGKANFCKFKFIKINVDEKEYADKVVSYNNLIREYETEIETLNDKLNELKTQKISTKELEKEITKKTKINNAEIKKLKEKISIARSDVLYEKQKKYFEKFHFKLMSKVCYCRFKEDGFDFLTEEKLKSLYKYIEDFIARWTHDVHIKEYEEVDFKPHPIPPKKDVFNLFTGLEYEKNMHGAVNLSEESILDKSRIFIKHLWYLSGKNNKVLDYNLKYLAHMVQEPGSLPRTSIVFKSEQGCGKNLFFENFAEKILGEQYLLATANLDHIIGRFPMISKKLLILMDEANGKESFLGSDKIKSFITAKNIPFEQKGIDPIMIRNCSRMIFFTNNDYPVKIEQSDRRFVVAECSTDIKNDTTYFKQLLDAFQDKLAISAFGLYLKRLDISNFDTTNDRPITRLYKEVQTATVPSEIRYFVENQFSDCDFTDEHSGESLYDNYVFWCDNSKKKYRPIAKQTFLSRIVKHDFILKKKSSSRSRLYVLHKQKMEEFVNNEKMKDEIDDDEEDEFEY